MKGRRGFLVPVPNYSGKRAQGEGWLLVKGVDLGFDFGSDPSTKI